MLLQLDRRCRGEKLAENGECDTDERMAAQSIAARSPSTSVRSRERLARRRRNATRKIPS